MFHGWPATRGTPRRHLGTAEAEQILRRFSGRGPKHPSLAAIEEMGRAVRTAFIPDYLAEPALRREIQEAPGCQAVELGERGHPLGALLSILRAAACS